MLLRSSLSAALCGLLIAGVAEHASAQGALVPAPWHSARAPSGLVAERYQPDHAAVRSLTDLSQVTLTGVALPGGGAVDLELTRVDVARRQFRFYVDDVEQQDLMNGLDLTVWRGSVVGIPNSSVQLGISHVGVRGFIHTGEELFHLIARPAAGDDGYASDVVCIEENELLRTGAAL